MELQTHTDQDILRDFRDFLADLLQVHMLLHRLNEGPRLPNKRRDCVVADLLDFPDRTKEVLFRHLGLTQEDLDEILRKVQYTPGGLFTRTIHERRILTCKPIVRLEFVHFKMARLHGIPDVSKMMHVHDTGDATDLGYHYFIRTDRERARLLQAVENEEDLPALDKALILEETFLH